MHMLAAAFALSILLLCFGADRAGAASYVLVTTADNGGLNTCGVGAGDC
jgi:hypothetical protein